NLLEEFGIDGSGFALTNALPSEVTLSSAYPNPFNSTTTIKFGMPEAGYVNIAVYDLNGRQVKTLVSNHLQAGYHNCVLEGNGFKSGTYLVRMISADKAQTLKLTFIK
ncbi:MAG: T9SS type A sorting domain-containing protein, partial [Calditrichaeota bacterium]|nr:T9SS type A sorting domain-containing protein [Calditrichota bacterium]